MRIVICVFVNLFVSTFLFAQIIGNVVDDSGNPVPFANVVLYTSPQETLEKGVLTNDNGEFEFNKLIEGTYFIRISLLSYQTWTSEPFTITNVNSTKRFAAIKLEEEAEALNEVVVMTKRKLIEYTQEGSVINVQESILTKGSSALQLLERSPGVILDQRNNNFSLNGKSGTMVMLNGKPMRIPMSDLIAMLNGMSADNIQKIELLTNPSARYDVDGNAGIINIVLIKNESLGFKGNYGITAGYGEGVKQAISTSLNYGSERLNTYGSYSFAYDDTFSQWSGIGSTENPSLGGTSFIEFSSKTSQINRSHNTTVGLEYSINDNTLFGTSILANIAKPTSIVNNRGTYDFEVDPYLEARIQRRDRAKWNNYNGSLYFETKNDHSKFGITTDFIRYNSETPNTVESTYFDENGLEFQPTNEIYNTGNRGFNTTQISVGVLKVDYKKDVNDNFSFEGGLKGTLSKTSNNARIEIQEGDNFMMDERFISNRKIDENIGSSYVLTDFNIDSTFTVQAGVRFEYWNRSFDETSLNREFGKFFPSLFLKKTFTDTKSLQVAYTKRITRPNYADLASFLSYNDPTSVFSGNPDLLPAITNSINLTYNYKSYSFSLIVSNEDNPLVRYQITRDERSDLVIVSPVNLKYQNSIDAQINIPIRITNWWSMNFNGTLGARQFQLLHTPVQAKHDYIHYNFNGSQVIKFNKDLLLEFSGWYTSKHFNGNVKVHGFGSLNGGIKKQFKNGSSLQFSVTDIFESINIKSQTGALTRGVFGGQFNVHYSPESTNSHIFRVSFSHSFGNKKVKSTGKRSTSDEEKSRVLN